MSLYEEYVDTGVLRFLSSYKLSQDHSETFFSAIRSKGGWDNHPSVRKFISAYKNCWCRLSLVTNQAPIAGLLTAPQLLMFRRSTFRNNDSTESVVDFLQKPAFGSEYCISQEDIFSLSVFVSDVTEYVVGFVTFSLSKNMACEVCSKAIRGTATSCKLLRRKIRGSLAIHSEDVTNICKTAEQEIRATEIIKCFLTKS